MMNDLEASRATEVQSLLEEQTQSLLSAYMLKERSIKRTSAPRDATHLMMLSDLVKDLLASYNSLDDASLLRVDWLCPLLTSCARSNDQSIRESVQTILERALKTGISDSNDHETEVTNVAAVEKFVADV